MHINNYGVAVETCSLCNREYPAAHKTESGMCRVCTEDQARQEE